MLASPKFFVSIAACGQKDMPLAQPGKRGGWNLREANVLTQHQVSSACGRAVRVSTFVRAGHAIAVIAAFPLMMAAGAAQAQEAMAPAVMPVSADKAFRAIRIIRGSEIEIVPLSMDGVVIGGGGHRAAGVGAAMAPMRSANRPLLQGGSPDEAFLMDDTLRAGDIVATSNGLKVFGGEEGLTHSKSDFVPLNRARHAAANARELSKSQSRKGDTASAFVTPLSASEPAYPLLRRVNRQERLADMDSAFKRGD